MVSRKRISIYLVCFSGNSIYHYRNSLKNKRILSYGYKYPKQDFWDSQNVLSWRLINQNNRDENWSMDPLFVYRYRYIWVSQIHSRRYTDSFPDIYQKDQLYYNSSTKLRIYIVLLIDRYPDQISFLLFSVNTNNGSEFETNKSGNGKQKRYIIFRSKSKNWYSRNNR